MPAGLDGNPDPVRSPQRDALLEKLAARIDAEARRRFMRVGVDGVAGSGKSTFADELAIRLRDTGHPVIRSTIDSFHRPRADRYRSGRYSPESYYVDSHDTQKLSEVLLEPFARGDPFRTACFDELSDTAVSPPFESAEPGAVLVFDGLFLHRPELLAYWDFSLFLVADQRVSKRRQDWEASAPQERVAQFRRRYVDGWEFYLRSANPTRAATVVVDNDDLSHPSLMG